MASIYEKGTRLYFRFKDPAGKWTAKSSGIAVGKKPDERRRNRRRAEGELAKLTAKVEVLVREGETGPLTLEKYLERWIEARKDRVQTWKDERTRIRLHVIPKLGKKRLAEIRTRHVREVILQLRAEGNLAPRTIRHVYGTLHTLCQNAVEEEVIEVNPCQLGKKDLPKKRDKDPAWRATAIFSRTEAEAIISDERIPLDRRVLYALLVIAGARFGEIAALRWRSCDRTLEPLGCLGVHVSYDVKTKKVKSVKSEFPRRVPIHPTLAKALAEWRLGGWAELAGRAATEDDLIIPSRRGGHRSVTLGRTKFHEDLERIGLRKRRIHDLRRTFISLCLADGARKDILRWVTHGPDGDIVDLYTTLPWSALCEEVAKLKISVREGKVIQLPKAAQAGENREKVTGTLLPPCYPSEDREESRIDVAEVHGNRTRRTDALATHHWF